MRTIIRTAAAVLVLASAFAAGARAAEDADALWKKTVAAAEQEGKVVLCIPPSNTFREFLLREWKKAFPKITMDASAIDESNWIQRVRVERGAHKFLWDAAMSGSVTTFTMKNNGFTVPIVPEFILPDVKDPKTWGGWDRVFFDNEHKYVLATQNFLKMPFFNAKLLSPEKVKAEGSKIFLDPALKGKIIWHDPLLHGSGETFAVVMRKLLGDEKLKTFVTGHVVFAGKMMTLVDKMARGEYAISFGPLMTSLLNRYRKAGLQLDIRPLGNTPEYGAYSNTGGSNLIVMKDAPHPNATKVFVNWLLSKDTATRLAKTMLQDSNRVDIPSQVPPEYRRVPGAKYIEPQRESMAGEVKVSHDVIRTFRREHKS